MKISYVTIGVAALFIFTTILIAVNTHSILATVFWGVLGVMFVWGTL